MWLMNSMQASLPNPSQETYAKKSKAKSSIVRCNGIREQHNGDHFTRNNKVDDNGGGNHSNNGNNNGSGNGNANNNSGDNGSYNGNDNSNDNGSDYGLPQKVSNVCIVVHHWNVFSLHVAATKG
ncbi:hypothetical protein Trydic_g7879 [Trypoxylus dichotomus]